MNETKMISKGMTEIPFLKTSLIEAREKLAKLTPEKRLEWAFEQFEHKFAITTSFGIQSSVLLNMIQKLNIENQIRVIWVDTGYLPPETYQYAASLSEKLDLKITVVQSSISPARMEALYGKLWQNNSLKDLETYHQIRKVQPLEEAFKKHTINCWASGVRSGQTNNRSNMHTLDLIRERISLRPILEWSQKDIFYYMKKHDLPQHPLFEKGYSTIGDWHSSAPDANDSLGRKTRFGGLKEECGIHIEESSNATQTSE